MKRVIWAAVTMMLVSLSAGNVLAGSNPHTRSGFFIGFNVGGGTADITIPNGSDTDREWGGAGNFRLGGALKNNLLLSGESTAWLKDEDNSSLTLGLVAFEVTYFPGDQGLFVKAGVGFASSSYEYDAGNGFTASKTENGFGLQAGAGYEWRLTRKFAMGPQVEYVYVNIGGDLVDTGNYFDATLGFNWYW